MGATPASPPRFPPPARAAIRALGRAGPRVATSHPLAAAVGFTLQRCCCFCERVHCCADDNRFFRVLDGMYDIWIAQFGISGDPATHKQWDRKVIRDDPVTKSNKRGTVSFAMSGPHTRTTQLFLNFGDSGKVLDRDFAPFGEVVKGMEVVDLIHKIGEGPPSGKGAPTAALSLLALEIPHRPLRQADTPASCIAQDRPSPTSCSKATRTSTVISRR